MLIRLFICRSVDQFHDGLNGIHLMAFAHGVYIILAVKVQFMYFIYQKIRRNIILIQDNGISLGFEGSSVQQLVSAAAGSRQGDQDVGLFQCQKLADGIGSGAGDHHISHGKDVF